ncbi:MAG: ABC transporter permease [Hyphomicrobiales bacterium]|nr:ABC transporter permease [Hyphomicrobiales bacterium]
MRMLQNIFWLGIKEIRSFFRDYVLVLFVVYSFSLQIMAQASSFSQEVHNASIAVVDEDHSELSRRITRAFLPPYFKPAQRITERDVVPMMNLGKYTFVIDIPPNFQRDVLDGRNPALQVNVDATMMVQGGLGAGYAQQIIMTEIRDFISHAEGVRPSPVNLDVRVMYNPNVTTSWFTGVMGIINNISMLAIILAGAAIIREREHGTMDHLLVMPITPFEIAISKVWANGLVITTAAGLSIYFVVRMLLGVPIAGSVPLFLFGVAIYLFFACAIGIFIGTVARSMPQLGLLYLLSFLPMNMLSGSNTPLESMPPWLSTIMEASPSTHFVSFAQSILYRGAGIDVVWRQFAFVAIVGGLFFYLAVQRFRMVTRRAI